MHHCSHNFVGHRFARHWRSRHGRHGETGHRHGGFGRGRLGRFFAHGDLRFLILKLIGDKPRHGYEVIKAIEEGVAGAYTPSPGVVYPTLTLLEEMGWVRITPSEGSKKLYEITEDGKLALEANRATVDIIIGRMAEIRGAEAEASARHEDDAYDRAEAAVGTQDVAPPIRRAMRHLMGALRRRLSRRDLSEAQVIAVAAILAEAAEEIERSD